MGVASAACFAVITLANRLLARTNDAVTIAFHQTGWAALVTVAVYPGVVTVAPRLGVWDVTAILFLGVLCTAGAHTLFVRSLRRVRAQRAAVVMTLEPVYGIVLAAIVLHEIPTLRSVVGGALILATTTYVAVAHQRGS